MSPRIRSLEEFADTDESTSLGENAPDEGARSAADEFPFGLPPARRASAPTPEPQVGKRESQSAFARHPWLTLGTLAGVHGVSEMLKTAQTSDALAALGETHAKAQEAWDAGDHKGAEKIYDELLSAPELRTAPQIFMSAMKHRMDMSSQRNMDETMGKIAAELPPGGGPLSGVELFKMAAKYPNGRDVLKAFGPDLMSGSYDYKPDGVGGWLKINKKTGAAETVEGQGLLTKKDMEALTPDVGKIAIEMHPDDAPPPVDVFRQYAVEQRGGRPGPATAIVNEARKRAGGQKLTAADVQQYTDAGVDMTGITYAHQITPQMAEARRLAGSTAAAQKKLEEKQTTMETEVARAKAVSQVQHEVAKAFEDQLPYGESKGTTGKTLFSATPRGWNEMGTGSGHMPGIATGPARDLEGARKAVGLSAKEAANVMMADRDQQPVKELYRLLPSIMKAQAKLPYKSTAGGKTLAVPAQPFDAEGRPTTEGQRYFDQIKTRVQDTLAYYAKRGLISDYDAGAWGALTNMLGPALARIETGGVQGIARMTDYISGQLPTVGVGYGGTLAKLDTAMMNLENIRRSRLGGNLLTLPEVGRMRMQGMPQTVKDEQDARAAAFLRERGHLR